MDFRGKSPGIPQRFLLGKLPEPCRRTDLILERPDSGQWFRGPGESVLRQRGVVAGIHVGEWTPDAETALEIDHHQKQHKPSCPRAERAAPLVNPQERKTHRESREKNE